MEEHSDDKITITLTAEEFAELQGALDARDSDTLDLRKSLRIAEKATRKATIYLDDAASDISEERKKNQILQKELAAMTAELALAKKTIRALGDDNEDLQAQVASEKKALATEVKELAACKAELQQLRKEKIEILSSHDTDQDTIAAQIERIAALTTASNTLNKTNAELAAALSALGESTVSIEEYNDIQSTLEATQLEYAKLSETLQDIQIAKATPPPQAKSAIPLSVDIEETDPEFFSTTTASSRPSPIASESSSPKGSEASAPSSKLSDTQTEKDRNVIDWGPTDYY